MEQTIARLKLMSNEEIARELLSNKKARDALTVIFDLLKDELVSRGLVEMTVYESNAGEKVNIGRTWKYDVDKVAVRHGYDTCADRRALLNEVALRKIDRITVAECNEFKELQDLVVKVDCLPVVNVRPKKD